MSNDGKQHFCRTCGSAVSEIDKYCPQCGAEISYGPNKAVILAFCIIGFLIIANITAFIGMIYQIKSTTHKYNQPRRIQVLREKEIDKSATRTRIC